MFLLFETIGLLKLSAVLSNTARHVSLCSHPIAFNEICEEGSVIDWIIFAVKNVCLELVEFYKIS